MNGSRLSHNLFHVPGIQSFRDAAAAIIFLDDGRYLMQHRDDKPGIFYPDHWGLFGGALERSEDPETALRRELKEELGHDALGLTYFTSMSFNFDRLGANAAIRVFYEVPLPAAALAELRLDEGQAMEALTAAEILLEKRVVPYDSFALWMHCAWVRQGSRASHSNRNKK